MSAPRRLRPAALGALLLATAAAAPAQKMFRCGSTYSQTPCDANTAPQRLHRDLPAAPGAPASAAAPSRGSSLCAEEIPRRLKLDGPNAATVLPVEAMGAVVIRYADQPLVARKYRVTLEARDAFGARMTRSYFCYVSEDERRLLKVE